MLAIALGAPARRPPIVPAATAARMLELGRQHLFVESLNRPKPGWRLVSTAGGHHLRLAMEPKFVTSAQKPLAGELPLSRTDNSAGLRWPAQTNGLRV